MNDMFHNLLTALLQHVPSSAAWMPLVGAAIVGALGLILMLKGARLAPALAALVAAGVCGVASSHAANWLSTPAWPTILVGAVAGGILGLVVFKLLLAGMVATCFIAAGLLFYGGTVLRTPLATYSSAGYDAGTGLVTLPGAAPSGAADALNQAAAGAGVQLPAQVSHAVGQLQSLWNHLAANVPNFQTSFWAIVVSSAIAGIVFGLFVPRLSRSLWAATFGTGLLVAGVTFVLEAAAPSVLTWLAPYGGWSWSVIGGVWLASLIVNLVDCRAKKTKVEIEVTGGGKKVATA
ncbi:MAG: hypothetical protein CHACPFDD_02790 [Phycisphaerae bacterium]|nr:hypothetical protein [Phycisphaerae bacterium]